MRKVYCQPYKGKKEISCWYGKPPKDIFQGDIICLQIPLGDKIYLTPDEVATCIRALSAGLHHYLVKEDKYTKMKNN